MKTKQIAILSALVLLSITACHKAENNTTTTNNTNTTPPTSAQVIADFCTHVAAPDYNDMYNNAITFQNAEATFYANPNDNDLNTMRTSWKAMRAAYEAAEGFLIGPISTQDLDPDIDTWPVEQNELDSILNGSQTLDAAYINGNTVPSSLKGFHPIEYLIFGTTGSATAASFTVTTTSPTGPRKKEYLHALTANIVSIASQIKDSYVVGSSNDYATVLNNAGSNSTYPTRKSALLDLVSAMSGICEEVGGSASDGKINSVYITQDVTLQESFFSDNSWSDFTKNIAGIKNMYMATYNGNASGHSIHDLVNAKNLSLDNTIKSKLDAAINAFSNAHLPFGQSVVSERTQVQNIMTAIRDLQDVLDDGTPNNNHDLADFMNQYVTD
jgi:putative iron-regulated protein